MRILDKELLLNPPEHLFKRMFQKTYNIELTKEVAEAIIEIYPEDLYYKVIQDYIIIYSIIKDQISNKNTEIPVVLLDDTLDLTHLRGIFSPTNPIEGIILEEHATPIARISDLQNWDINKWIKSMKVAQSKVRGKVSKELVTSFSRYRKSDIVKAIKVKANKYTRSDPTCLITIANAMDKIRWLEIVSGYQEKQKDGYIQLSMLTMYQIKHQVYG